MVLVREKMEIPIWGAVAAATWFSHRAKTNFSLMRFVVALEADLSLGRTRRRKHHRLADRLKLQGVCDRNLRLQTARLPPSELLGRSKGLVATHPRPSAVGRSDSEMVGGVRSQPRNVGSDIPERVSSLSLHGRGVPVIGRCAILETNGGGQPMRIQ